MENIDSQELVLQCPKISLEFNFIRILVFISVCQDISEADGSNSQRSNYTIHPHNDRRYAAGNINFTADLFPWRNTVLDTCTVNPVLYHHLKFIIILVTNEWLSQNKGRKSQSSHFLDLSKWSHFRGNCRTRGSQMLGSTELQINDKLERAEIQYVPRTHTTPFF